MRVAVVDRDRKVHRVFQDALRALGVVGAHDSYFHPDDAMNALGRTRPHFVVIGVCCLRFSDFEFITKAQRLAPCAAIIVLAEIAAGEEIRRCLEAGARGFLMKPLKARLVSAQLEMALLGEPALCARALSVLASHPDPFAAGSCPAFLTPREQQVLRCVELGASDKEIAERLGISVAAVKRHLANTYRKLGVHRRGAAVRTANGEVSGTPDLRLQMQQADECHADPSEFLV